MKKTILNSLVIPASLILFLTTSCKKAEVSSLETEAKMSLVSSQSAALVVEPFAGGEFGYRNGPALQAAFKQIGTVATAPNGDVYVNEYSGFRQTQIRKISSADPSHQVTTVLELEGIADIVVSCDGLLYLAVNILDNDGYIYRLNKNGKLTLVYRTPHLITALAVGADKTLYLGIGDWPMETAKIERVSPNGNVTLLAGGEAGYVNGTGSVARFREITKMVLGNNNTLYACDVSSHTIRKITSAGEVTTLAGQDRNFGTTDGTGANATFNFPADIAIDKTGNLYTSDYSYGTIRKITPQGVVTTLTTLDFWTQSLAEHDGTLYIAGEDSFIKKVSLN